MALTALVTPARAQESAVVLMYHRFGEDKFPSTSIRTDQFEAQLDYLAQSGYQVIPLTQLMAARNGQAQLPDKAVVITIDDAYLSVFEVAYPRLRAAGYPFTVFVATDPVDENLPAYMSWQQMRSMAEGGASYANHGAAHRSLLEREAVSSETDWLAAIQADLDRGWQRLSEELEPLPGLFAYPYGEYDTKSAALVARAGYVAFGQQSGAVGFQSDNRALPRFPMAENFADLDGFRTKVASLPLPVASVTPWEPVTANRQPTIKILLSSKPPRWAELACFVSGQGTVPVHWLADGQGFSVGPKTPLAKGRQRVNCTAPGPDGRYFWFSHPWIVRGSN